MCWASLANPTPRPLRAARSHPLAWPTPHAALWSALWSSRQAQVVQCSGRPAARYTNGQTAVLAQWRAARSPVLRLPALLLPGPACSRSPPHSSSFSAPAGCTGHAGRAPGLHPPQRLCLLWLRQLNRPAVAGGATGLAGPASTVASSTLCLCLCLGPGCPARWLSLCVLLTAMPGHKRPHMHCSQARSHARPPAPLHPRLPRRRRSGWGAGGSRRLRHRSRLSWRRRWPPACGRWGSALLG